MKTYNLVVVRHSPIRREVVKYMKSGEFREPRKGEFFISGAIPSVYEAPNDISQKYHIAMPFDKAAPDRLANKLLVDICGLVETRSRQNRAIDKDIAIMALQRAIDEIKKL